MIDPQLLAKINDIRKDFLHIIDSLHQTRRLQELQANSDKLRGELAELQRIAGSPRIRQSCSPRFACAFVGSSGHGKTTILAEMFPDLARRGWLQTDKNDTTSQALIIRPMATQQDEVMIHSWDVDQITRLVKTATTENERTYLRVCYQADGVTIDGTRAVFATDDMRKFKFPLQQTLQPLPHSYLLSVEERTNSALIRSLTVKEESEKVPTQPLLTVEGRPFNALQLRAIVKAIDLRDPFQQVATWSVQQPGEVSCLVFIDTPGLNVPGNIKDEVLRHVLFRKNQQVVVELLRHEELDLIVHLVLCGEQSAFSQVWKAVEEQCDPTDLADLSERLLLAVNGTNIYFTNPDVRRKWESAAVAEREGDHFANTLDDNILKRMSERGTIRPARICFLDSRRIVEAAGRSYQDVYAGYRPILESWVRPDGIGYKTLQRHGLLKSFAQNIEALCDPTDRGQGFLIRQVLDLIHERGAHLFLRKYLVRSKLHRSIKKLREVLLRYYEPSGRLNFRAIQNAIRTFLRFLEPNGLRSIEVFARQNLDAAIDRLVPGPDTPVDASKWVSKAFKETCKHFHLTIREKAHATAETDNLFTKYLQERMIAWNEQWGYKTAELPPPTRQQPATADLLRHCLKTHAREMLYQLFVEGTDTRTAGNLPQNPQEQEQMFRILERLDEMDRQANTACLEHGVPLA